MKKLIYSTMAVVFFLLNANTYATDSPPRTENLASVVKLNFLSGISGNICVGTLLNENIVLTASHCIIDNWAADPNKRLQVFYGKNFSHTAGLYKGEGQSWVKFDPETDLALIRLDTSVVDQENVVPATLVKSCSTLPALNSPLIGVEYRRMQDDYQDLPREKHNTSTIAFDRIGNSALANGKSYSAPGPNGRPGDSGGGVFSEDGILFGVFNGTAGTRDYVSVLCVYADRIHAESAKLGSPIS